MLAIVPPGSREIASPPPPATHISRPLLRTGEHQPPQNPSSCTALTRPASPSACTVLAETPDTASFLLFVYHSLRSSGAARARNADSVPRYPNPSIPAV